MAESDSRWSTTAANITVFSSGNQQLPKFLSCKLRVGQNIALYASSTARNFVLFSSVFVCVVLVFVLLFVCFVSLFVCCFGGVVVVLFCLFCFVFLPCRFIQHHFP